MKIYQSDSKTRTPLYCLIGGVLQDGFDLRSGHELQVLGRLSLSETCLEQYLLKIFYKMKTQIRETNAPKQ